MPVKLVSKSLTYDFVVPVQGDEEKDWPVFKLRYITAEEANRIEDQLVVSNRDDEKMSFLAGRSNELKIRYAVADWKNIFLDTGSPAPCNDQTKLALPAWLQAAVVKKIDSDNGLKKVDKDEKN
jgi:hypothetical protein